MKRNVTAPKGAEVKAPEPPRAEIRQFGNAIEFMVEQMAKRWRNQVFEELNQSTIKKFSDFRAELPFRVAEPYTVTRKVTTFTDSAGETVDEDQVRCMSDYEDPELYTLTATDREVTETKYTYRTEFRDVLASEYIRAHGITDAQVGNFARVFLKMAERVRRKLIKQFDDGRLEKLAKNYTGKVDRRNKAEFYRRIENRVGITRQELEATEGLTFQINAYQLETFQWIRKMRDDTMQQWTSNTLRDMAEGKGLPEIMEQFDGMVEKRKNHAKMVARTQISTFNSLTSKARAQNLGITKAVWKTSADERVRKCHQVRNGKEFDISEGLYSSCDGKTLLPGVDFQCRCDYRLLIPAMEDSDNG